MSFILLQILHIVTLSLLPFIQQVLHIVTPYLLSFILHKLCVGHSLFVVIYTTCITCSHPLFVYIFIYEQQTWNQVPSFQILDQKFCCWSTATFYFLKNHKTCLYNHLSLSDLKDLAPSNKFISGKTQLWVILWHNAQDKYRKEEDLKIKL